MAQASASTAGGLLMNAIHMQGFPLAGLLSNVMVSHRSKAEIGSCEMMANDDMSTLYEDKNGPSSQEFSDSIKKVAATGPHRGIFAPVRAREKILSAITARGGNHTTGWNFRRSTRAGMVWGDEMGDTLGAARVTQQAGQSSAASYFGDRRCSSVRATLTSCWISSPAFAPISSMRVSASLAKRSADSTPSPDWRRAISPRIAVTMKLALLSPSFLTDAISSKTSCGTRAFICWDLLLVELVDMDSILPESVIQHTQKVNRIKELWCDSLSCIVNTTLSTGKAQVSHKKAKPGSALTLTGPLTTSVIISNEVAMYDHITPISGRDSLTLKKYQYRFMAISRADTAARPCRVSIEATPSMRHAVRWLHCSSCLWPLAYLFRRLLMLNHFTVYGYGVNQRGLTIGINHKSLAESQESARAAAMLKAQDSGLCLIRITRIQEVAV